MKDLTDEQLDAIAGSSDYFDGYMAIRAASAADRALNAPADRTYEQEHAIKEGHRNKIEDDYFDARPGFSQVHRVSFRGGFDRGWDAAKKDAPAGRDVMRNTPDGWNAALAELRAKVQELQGHQWSPSSPGLVVRSEVLALIDKMGGMV